KPEQEEPFHDDSDKRDGRRREDERRPEADAQLKLQEVRGERAEHVEGPVREVDDPQHAEDDREAEREKRIERPVDESVEHLKGRVAEIHPGSARPAPHFSLLALLVLWPAALR